MSEVIKNSAVAIDFGSEKKKRNGNNRSKSFRKPKLSLDEKMLESLIKAVERDGGKYIKFNADQYGMLVGGVREIGGESNLYFVWIDNDRNIQIQSTYDTYKLLRDALVNVSILDYVVRNDRMYILNKLDAWFEQNKDKYSKVTDFVLPSYKRNTRNFNKNFKKKKD